MLCAANVNITAALSGISSVTYNQGQCSVSCTGILVTLQTACFNPALVGKTYDLMCYLSQPVLVCLFQLLGACKLARVISKFRTRACLPLCCRVHPAKQAYSCVRIALQEPACALHFCLLRLEWLACKLLLAYALLTGTGV